jgi:hypothetical protein
MTQPSQIVVVVETSVRQVASDGFLDRVRTSLRYDPAEPCSVEVLFHFDDGYGPVRWSFARELLVDGLDEPAGLGDVRIWPWPTPRGDLIALAISSPEGHALFEVPRAVLVRFLRRTYAVVPRGRESVQVHLDLDADLATLFEFE